MYISESYKSTKALLYISPKTAINLLYQSLEQFSAKAMSISRHNQCSVFLPMYWHFRLWQIIHTIHDRSLNKEQKHNLLQNSGGHWYTSHKFLLGGSFPPLHTVLPDAWDNIGRHGPALHWSQQHREYSPIMGLWRQTRVLRGKSHISMHCMRIPFRDVTLLWQLYEKSMCCLYTVVWNG